MNLIVLSAMGSQRILFKKKNNKSPWHVLHRADKYSQSPLKLFVNIWREMIWFGRNTFFKCKRVSDVCVHIPILIDRQNIGLHHFATFKEVNRATIIVTMLYATFSYFRFNYYSLYDRPMETMNPLLWNTSTLIYERSLWKRRIKNTKVIW